MPATQPVRGGLPVATGLMLFLPLALLGNVASAALRYPDIGAAVLFPPYAVLTAALVIAPRRDGIWYVAAGAAAHFVTHWPQWSLSWVLLADVANIARALTAATLLRWLLGRSLELNSVRAVLLFGVAAGVVAPAVGATLGAASVVWHGGSSAYWRPWVGWFVSNALTGLSMLLAAIAAFEFARLRQRPHVPRARMIEGCLLALAIAVTCVIAFIASPNRSLLALPLYAPLPALIWAAVRFGSGCASLSLSAVAILAIWSADHGAGPFGAIAIDDSILALQLFVLCSAILLLCLSAISTSRRQAQLEIDEQRSALSHLARVSVLGQLSGAFAHELNQPLAAMLANAEAARHLLRRQPPDLDEVDEILRDIADSGQRAGAVIQRLRALFTRADRRDQAINARELVDDVLKLVHSEITRRQISTTVTMSPNLPAFPADRVQLQQMFLNLILNACEAMSALPVADRRLEVTAAHDTVDQVHFAIRDFGAGIPRDVSDRLFEPFVTTKADGLGLGLSVSQTIVVAHGGRLWAEDHRGAGTTMHCVFPVNVSAAIVAEERVLAAQE